MSVVGTESQGRGRNGGGGEGIGLLRRPTPEDHEREVQWRFEGGREGGKVLPRRAERTSFRERASSNFLPPPYSFLRPPLF